MFDCQHGRAPQCLIDYCLPVSEVASRQHLRSASRRLLVVPRLSRHRLSTYGRRAFAVSGPTAWNSFPDNLRDPDVTMDNYLLTYLNTYRLSNMSTQYLQCCRSVPAVNRTVLDVDNILICFSCCDCRHRIVWSRSLPDYCLLRSCLPLQVHLSIVLCL